MLIKKEAYGILTSLSMSAEDGALIVASPSVLRAIPLGLCRAMHVSVPAQRSAVRRTWTDSNSDMHGKVSNILVLQPARRKAL
jgi:hypothetical protein